MTRIIAQFPVTAEIDLPSGAETLVGRIAEVHALLKDGVVNLTVPAKTAAGSTSITFRGVDHERLAASWDDDAENAELTTWNSLGQRLDTRSYVVEPHEGSDDTLVQLRCTPDGENWKTIAVVSHTAVAEAIGDAWMRGAINFHPRYSFV